MNNVSTLICKKYLSFKKKDKNISFMIKICFLGILIGTFSLMLTLIIMNGFEKVIHEKMQGINAQILIYSPGNEVDYPNVKNYLMKNFANEIEGVGANTTRQILIDKDKKTSVLFIKGVDPQAETKVTNLNEKIILPQAGSKNILPDLLNENGIIVGSKTAKNYNLKLGEKITLLIPKAQSNNKIGLKKKDAVITGFFKIGLEEYDNNFAFSSLDFLKDLFKEKDVGVDQITVKLKPQQQIFSFKNFIEKIKHWCTGKTEEDLMIKKISKNLPGLTVTSWKNLYPALVSSLKLEKYVMFFILALIILVASMNMISMLFMQIQNKRRDIAILKSMGLPNKNIRSIFLKLGMSIVLFASVIGLFLAFIAGSLIEKYPFIELPDVYYVSYLPAKMDVEIFVVVFLATMLIGFLSTWIPAKRTRKINIAQVLRQE
ncbi:MAG: ABC transporter permease [bacterium]